MIINKKKLIFLSETLKSFSLAAIVFAFSAVGFSQENCSNGIDDDGDGFIDCLDSDCLGDIDACPAFNGDGGCLLLGTYPDILGTVGAFKDGGSVDDMNMTFPNGTKKITLIIQGLYEGPSNTGTGSNDENHLQERVVSGSVEIDLDSMTSTGWASYFINNNESKRFSWVNESLSALSTSTYVRKGHDFTELTDFEFTFNTSGNDLVVGCSEQEISISYFAVCYGNFLNQSLRLIDGVDPSQYPVYFSLGTNAESLTQTINMSPAPNRPNYIEIRGIGLSANNLGNGSVPGAPALEEGVSWKYILIDLNTLTASGSMMISNGNSEAMTSCYSFSDYDLTSGQSILNNATVIGDIEASLTPQVGLCDLTLEITGDDLTLTRENEYAEDFQEMFYVKLLKYADQPFSSSFITSQNGYSGPEDIGTDLVSDDGVSIDGFLDFVIPEGSKFATLEMSSNGIGSSDLSNFQGPATNADGRSNNNQMHAYAEINFDLEETDGFYVRHSGNTNQQLYAWKDIPIDPSVDFATSPGIYGSLPNSDERINFEIIEPDIFRVHLSNDRLRYERILSINFAGVKGNLVSRSLEQNFASTQDCESVYFDLMVCNAGTLPVNESIPVSFYFGDPTQGVAELLETDDFTFNIGQGQCEMFSFSLDKAQFTGNQSGELTVVLNDDGSSAGSLFTWEDIASQKNGFLECEYEYNFITTSFDSPRVSANFIHSSSLLNESCDAQRFDLQSFDNLSEIYIDPNPSAQISFLWNSDVPNAEWEFTEDISKKFNTVYDVSGTYEACLVAMVDGACNDTICKEIIVCDELIFVPVNIFTPNGDGINDFFSFLELSQSVSQFSCTIVNRWGRTIHEMSDISSSWDGKNPSGNLCSDGVYFYVYEGVSLSGEEFKGQGTVQLVIK